MILSIVGSPVSFYLNWKYGNPVGLWMDRVLTETIPWAATQPIGAFGLALVLWTAFWVAFVLGMAWRDTRPVRPAPRALIELQEDLANARAQIRSNLWWWNYRIQPPRMLPSELADEQEARREIARLGSVIGPLSMSLERLTTDLLDGLRRDSALLLTSASHAFYEELVGPTRRLLALLNQPGDEDPRGVFTAFLERYRELRTWMDQAAAFQGRPLAAFQAYAAWRNADARFFDEVARIPNLPPFQRLRHFIAMQQNEGFPGVLPPPIQTEAAEADEEGVAVRSEGGLVAPTDAATGEQA